MVYAVSGQSTDLPTDVTYTAANGSTNATWAVKVNKLVSTGTFDYEKTTDISWWPSSFASVDNTKGCTVTVDSDGVVTIAQQ